MAQEPVISIDLEDDQIEALQPLYERLVDTTGPGFPGMMIGQINSNLLDVRFVEYEDALKLRRIFNKAP